MTETASEIGVIGAGSWGTALAIQLGRAGQHPTLWGREPEVIQALTEQREEIRRLEGVGVHAFLVGESLMREADVGLALRRLRGTS